MTKPFRTLDGVDLAGKRVLLRVDLNVPTENGRVTDATRIERVAPTIAEIADKGGKVILLAHFGRPKGGPDEANSLKPVAAAVAAIIKRPVAFATDCIGKTADDAIAKMNNGDVLLLENTRFHKGEEKNDPAHVDELAKLGDIYVNDAFSAAHRAHATTHGLAHKLPAHAGRAMQKELEALELALGSPARPVAAIVGGAKVSTKLELLGNLVNKVDVLIIGGGMANTFLFAEGKEVGKSLCEKDLADTARSIVAAAEKAKCRILLPVDATVAKEFKAHAPARVAGVDHVADDEMILDIGPKSIAAVEKALDEIKTLVWNGPFGAFETPPFDKATMAIAKTAARLTKQGKLTSVAGGGDTVAALNEAKVADDLTYVSTAGGAFLEWMEGKALPGVEALRAR
jgi:phosphoglycerate kinase